MYKTKVPSKTPRIISLSPMLEFFYGSHMLGTVWVRVFGPLASFLSLALVIRILGSELSNSFMVLYSTALFASGLSDFGLRNTAYIESSSKQGHPLLDYIGKAYSLKVTLGTSVFMGFSFYAYFSLQYPLATCLLFGVIASTMYLADPGVQIIRGKLLSKLEIFLTLVEKMGLLFILFIMWFFKRGSLLEVGIAFAVTALFRSWIVYRLVVLRIGRFSLRPLQKNLLAMMKHTFFAGISLLIIQFMQRFPVILAPYLGFYEFSTIIAIVLMVIQKLEIFPTIVAYVVLPSALQKNTDTSKLHRTFKPMILLNLGAGLLSIALVAILARNILNLFGDEYVKYAFLLFVTSMATPLIFLNQTIRYTAIARNLSEYLVAALTLGLALALIIFFGLTKLIGWEGAVYSYALSQVTLFLIMMIFLGRRLSDE